MRPGGTFGFAIATGDAHSCALMGDGLIETYSLSCWGSDSAGQLGNGVDGALEDPSFALTYPASAEPAVAAGSNFTCALYTTGDVSCWGDNEFGQLGNGVARIDGDSAPDIATPPDPIALPGPAVSVTAGSAHACVMLLGGSVSCWGRNDFGQTGGGVYSASVPLASPVVLPGPAIGLSAGAHHTCALIDGGDVVCWGSDSAGQLGDGTASAGTNAPTQPLALPSPTTGIELGSLHSCALVADGDISCWGADTSGQDGDGTPLANLDEPSDPIGIPQRESGESLGLGDSHSCAVYVGGEITCWGSDAQDQLGNGTGFNDESDPPSTITLPGTAAATTVVGGGTHSCAVLTSGDLTCWGVGLRGQLGLGVTVDHQPEAANLVQFQTTGPVTAIDAGASHTCAVHQNGDLVCWGWMRDGRLGNGNTTTNSAWFPSIPILNLDIAAEVVVVEPQPTTYVAHIGIDIASGNGGQTAVGDGVGDPVNTATGNLTDSQADLSGEAFGLDLVRSYNTFDAAVSPLGERWRIGTGSNLDDVNSDVRLTLADGSPFIYTPDGSGGWTSPAGITATLTVDPAAPVGAGTLAMLRVTYKDGRVERFDTDGRLIEQIAWDGRTATSSHGAGGLLATVTASTGQTLTFGYDGSNRLVSAALSTGRTVSYGYDANGRLSSFMDEFGATTTMTYTPEGRWETTTDPSGVVTMANTYDTDGRVATQTSDSGGVMTFTYHLETGATDVHDSVTDTTVRYQHDPLGRVTSITDSFGEIAERGYDTESQLTDGIDRNGLAASATYDANGNVLTTTQPGVGTTTYTYDTLNRLESMTTSAQATTTYGYDGDERIPSTVTNELDQVTTYDVVDGLVMSVTDADAVATTYGYDTQRRLTSVTNAYNESTTYTYTYNARGQRETMLSPSGRTTTWAYDPITHRLASTTAPDTGVTSYTYDDAGRVLTITDPTNAVTINTYDTAGRLETTTDAGGAITQFEYDASDHLVKTIEPGGGEITATYGPLGRVDSTTDQQQRSTSYTYDAEGRQATVTDAGGGVSETLYDAEGRPFKTIDALDRETVTVYDQYGRVDTITAPGGLTTSYIYDSLGRVDTVTDPRTGTTTTAYTPGGRVDSVTGAAGLTTSYGYDLAGRRKTVTAPGNLTTTYTYNLDSQVETVTSPGGLVTANTYDLAGRVETVTDPAGVLTTNTWSLRGELLTTATGAEGTVIYDYNPNGTLADVTDALGNETTFGYDDRHNLTLRTAPNGAEFEWTYNAANQVTTAIDPLDRTTTYTYDTAGRLDTVTDPSGRGSSTTYRLDGSIDTVSYLGGDTTTYGYDPTGQLTTLTDTDGTHTLSYEPGGQLASSLDPDGRLTTWAYDQAGRRTEIHNPDGSSYTYDYDPVTGRLTTITPGEILADTFTAPDAGFPDTNRWTTNGTGTAAITTDAVELTWSSTNGASAALTANTPALTDTEQLVSYQFDSTAKSSGATFTVAARDSAAGHVRVEIGSDATAGNIIENDGTSDTTIGTFPVAKTTNPRWIRLNVTDTTVNVRTWDDGNSEPTGWNTATTDHTTPGVTRIEASRVKGTNTITVDDYLLIDPTTPATPVVTYGYNDDGQITFEALPDGDRTRTFNTFGQLTDYATTLPGLDLATSRTYDATGRIDTENTDGVTTTYTYDPASQLLAATPTTGPSTNWNYDLIGQRDTETVDTVTTSYQRDIAGQLCWTTTDMPPPTPDCAAPPTGATTYTHDTAGRLIAQDDANEQYAYSYDPEGRLADTTLTTASGTTTTTREYDHLGQLAYVDTTGVTVSASSFEWDPTRRAEQLTAITTNGATTGLVRGLGDWATARYGGTHTGIGNDVRASILPTTGTTMLAAADNYNPYGMTATPASGVALGYRGELTINHQIYLRNRYYQSELGQFTTTDPIPGRAGTTTLNNTYTYANNSPIHNIDPHRSLR
jgi:RHS repeat-associated protein